MVKGVNQFFGVSTDDSKADQKLNIIAAKLTATVPRFEGPQGVLDVQLYQQAAGELGDTTVPTGDRIAAAELMGELLYKYGATGTGDGTPPSRILVTNGQETFEIDAADLEAAMAEGFQQQ
jgi:hypothetical protein